MITGFVNVVSRARSALLSPSHRIPSPYLWAGNLAWCPQAARIQRHRKLDTGARWRELTFDDRRGGGGGLVAVVRGGLMVKQRGARIPRVFALCPVDLALCHLTERSALSSPARPSDLAGLERLQGHYLAHEDENSG